MGRKTEEGWEMGSGKWLRQEAEFGRNKGLGDSLLRCQSECWFQG